MVEQDDLSLDYLTDEEVYELLAAAEPLSNEELEQTQATREEGGPELGFQIAYGWNVFFVGSAVYFYWVDQPNNYRCTTSARYWSRVNSYQLVRRCASNGRWIYQLGRWN